MVLNGKIFTQIKLGSLTKNFTSSTWQWTELGISTCRNNEPWYSPHQIFTGIYCRILRDTAISKSYHSSCYYQKGDMNSSLTCHVSLSGPMIREVLECRGRRKEKACPCCITSLQTTVPVFSQVSTWTPMTHWALQREPGFLSWKKKINEQTTVLLPQCYAKLDNNNTTCHHPFCS